MDSKEENKGHEQQLKELLRIIKRVFFSIIRVDLTNDTAYVLQSIDFPKAVGNEFGWNEYLNRYNRFVDREVIEDFSAKNLLELYKSGKKAFSKESSYMAANFREWLTMETFFEVKEKKVYATIIVRKSTQEHLQKSILEMYVYNKCDQFLYLDAKNDSYSKFYAKDDGTLAPAEESRDYTAEVMRYVKESVVQEDQMKVMHKMSLKHVLEQLEEKENYSFSCGINDPERGYTRKLFEYQYYDRATGKILISRTDITAMYRESKAKQAELLSALERACTDSLTGILNHQGTVDEVTFCLKEDSGRTAIVFIDMDNFKDVNDSLGHIEGDNLLRQIANILRTGVRSDDLVGRIGGDEFMVCLRNVRSTDEVKECAQRLCSRIRRLSIDFGFPISSSMGIAVSPDDGTDYLTLTETADKRVYLAKSRGKNQIVLE